MLRSFNIIALALTIALSFGLYDVKYRAQHEEQRISLLERKIAEEQDTMRVLEAEWSYLNAPERLERLTARYLDLAPVRAGQVVSFEDLPSRQPDAELLGLPQPRMGGYASAEVSGQTGGQVQ